MNNTKLSINDLKFISRELRKRIVKTSSNAKIPHLGSCLSCIDLLVYLYWNELSIDPNNPNELVRDRFILSKGHGAPALFQVLGEKGFFPLSKLEDFGKAGSVFHEHPPEPSLVNGVEAATGSLGHGFPMALGMALAAKIRKLPYRTYSIVSDGECNEGSIWESAMLASSNNISSLTVIVDYNKWQATGRSSEILALEPLASKWKSFGWHVNEIDGHSFSQIESVLEECRNETKKPSAVIAHTIKGKGVSFMEDDNNWHYRTPNELELKRALDELEKLQ